MTFRKVRKNKFFKFISFYLALNIIFPPNLVSRAYALTGGPSQPEFNSFTPISTSDMVNLSSGDFKYNIPLMDVGGYPLSLGYNSGITSDQEASWVGLGWDLSAGQINRSVRGIPDDFKGDKMKYQNNLRTNFTVGTTIFLSPSFLGFNEKDAGVIKNKLYIGVGIQYNNYNGVSFRPSLDLNRDISKSVSLNFHVSSSTEDGVNASLSLSRKNKDNDVNYLSGSLGINAYSRQGLSYTASVSASGKFTKKVKENNKVVKKDILQGSGSLSYNFSNNNSVLFTPVKRVAMKNFSFTFNASGGFTLFGADGMGKINGFYSQQNIAGFEKDKSVPAYGYEFNKDKTENAILDFNREKDRSYTQLTKTLAPTNFTYDVYSINGQGISGAFRPYQSQIGYINSPYVSDTGAGASLGLEGEAGNIAAIGVDEKLSPTNNHTGIWDNDALSAFKYDENFSIPNYEPTYYRLMTEINVDNAIDNGAGDALYTKLGEEYPVRLELKGNKYHRDLENKYIQEYYSGTSHHENGLSSESSYKRVSRLLRNTSIQKITKQEAEHDVFITPNPLAKPHHTAGYKILQPNGATYVYGKALYNKIKKEVSFAVSEDEDIDYATGLVSYSSGSDNSVDNNNGVDHFFNRIITPPYAHTYLLTSVLSADYEDSDELAGPSDGDIGSYTLFHYDAPYEYQWRVPFARDFASANPGFRAHPNDQKGNYIYGVREQTYLHEIETKTHIAVFYVSDRDDAFGVSGENGGNSNWNISMSKKLDSIQLFSKTEYRQDPSTAIPIKTVHFEYDYTLAEGGSLPNNKTPQGGKLTLKKVYFTYGKSKMGKYTPYKFEYGQFDINNDNIFEQNITVNKPYNLKSYDIWGYYKSNENTDIGIGVNDQPTTTEMPYVSQDNRVEAIKNAANWTLTTIKLPSGGDIRVFFEPDEYRTVQNKKALQMFEVFGVGDLITNGGNSGTPDIFTDGDIGKLYSSSADAKYIFIKVPQDPNGNYYSVSDFIDEIENDPIYFKFLLNMTWNSSHSNNYKYDYVSGYFQIDRSNGKDVEKVNHNGIELLAIPMKTVDKEGGWFTSHRQVNPISKAGWYFGRQNMNKIVYSYDNSYTNDDVGSVLLDLVSSIASLSELISGPNGKLRDHGVAKYFIPHKSWIRLQVPSGRKLGGGSRVRRLEMHDNWETMIANNGFSVTAGDERYHKFYGQVYDYNNEDGTSSGVATFEPAGSKENPFVKPIYDSKGNSSKDRLLFPQDQNFFEGPIGEGFYPSPTVTYGRVSVSSLKDGQNKRHATGKVVHEFYTSYDFPTKTFVTELDKDTKKYDKPGVISKLLNFSLRTHLTMSQGFSIVKNDMNGKPKAEWVYAEGSSQPISGVEYIYNLKNDGTLNNEFQVVDEKGKITTSVMGVNFGVINDFRESVSQVETVGINFNLHNFVLFIPLAIPIPIPSYNYRENQLRMATTTKVVEKHGLLKKKIAHDLGATVSTENMLWDAQTGAVVVTKTENEFGETYYSINYPAHWYDAYKGMRQASKNINMSGKLTFHAPDSSDPASFGTFTVKNTTNDSYDTQIFELLTMGDELDLYDDHNTFIKKFWLVYKYDETGARDSNGNINVDDVPLVLMDKYGNIPGGNGAVEGTDISDCNNIFFSDDTDYTFKVVRSGFRNLHTASMASITTTKNPIINNSYLDDLSYTGVGNEGGVINANAVEYSDFWGTQYEENFVYIPQNDINSFIGTQTRQVGNPLPHFTQQYIDYIAHHRINPYVFNIRGDWRAKRSYAYLTGRYYEANAHPKKDGYFEKFSQFYTVDPNSGVWSKDSSDWTNASTVTKYSPYGVELENKDALGRYSSAQYGYHYTLPMAVASNTAYREIAYDGFEDHEDIASIPVMDYHFSIPGAYTYLTPPIITDSIFGYYKQYNNHHFNFEDVVADTQGASYTTEERHTGQYSIKLAPDSKLSIKKYIDNDISLNPPSNCEETFYDTINFKEEDGNQESVIFKTSQKNIGPCTKLITITLENDLSHLGNLGNYIFINSISQGGGHIAYIKDDSGLIYTLDTNNNNNILLNGNPATLRIDEYHKNIYILYQAAYNNGSTDSSISINMTNISGHTGHLTINDLGCQIN